MDVTRFPLVVDSDPEKVGTYVPGVGQVISSPEELRKRPVEVIIIPMQWRAQDILDEIERDRIPFDQILIEYQGRLIDYLREKNPYRRET